MSSKNYNSSTLRLAFRQYPGQFHGKGCIFLQVKIAQNKANTLSIYIIILEWVFYITQ